MVSVLSNGVTGRLAGWLFLAAGSTVGLSLFLPMPGTVNRAGTLALCAVGIGIGIAAIRAPWDDWPRSRTLLLVPVAFGMIAVGGLFVFEVVQYSYGIFWMLAFTWVGLGHPRWTSARIAPLAAVGLIIPIINITIPITKPKAKVIVAFRSKADPIAPINTPKIKKPSSFLSLAF